jgi:hypothetical protein
MFDAWTSVTGRVSCYGERSTGRLENNMQFVNYVVTIASSSYSQTKF